MLWALDHKTIKQFSIYPKNIAFENDLYKIEKVNEDSQIKPDYLEQKVFAAIESKVAPVIKWIDEKECLPNKYSEDFCTLMEFICLLFVRTPRFKENTNEQFDKVLKWYLNTDLAHMKQYESYRAQTENTLKQFDPSLNFEGYKKYVKKVTSDNYQFEWTQNHFLKFLLEAWKENTPYFFKRTWDIYIADSNDNDNFISCDNPVSLDWSDPNFNSGLYGVGLALKKTQISIPLTKKIALIGTFENEGKVVKASRYEVAAINSLTGMNAKRFVFSPYKNFYWLDTVQKVCRSEELIRLKRQESLGSFKEATQ